MPGYTMLGVAEFSCANNVEGENRFSCAVHQCDAFVEALLRDGYLRERPTAIYEARSTGAFDLDAALAARGATQDEPSTAWMLGAMPNQQPVSTAVDTEFVLLPPLGYGNAEPNWSGKPFLIARTCVSQRVYDALNGEHDDYVWPGPLQPANQVSWNDAQAWFQQNELAADGLRLPSEAEWEFACRAGTQSDFCFGNGKNALADIINFNCRHTIGHPSKRPERTIEVGSLPCNAFGLHEVHGNLEEWCENTQESRAIRAVRGGGWGNNGIARSVQNHQVVTTYRHRHIGFRPARSVD
ncbi:MAG: formylglycine-generating enzyme family protein [Planctomycetota bacterium]